MLCHHAAGEEVCAHRGLQHGGGGSRADRLHGSVPGAQPSCGGDTAHGHALLHGRVQRQGDRGTHGHDGERGEESSCAGAG